MTETLRKEKLNITDAVTLINSIVSNFKNMNNNREVTSNSINESLEFVKSFGEALEIFPVRELEKFLYAMMKICLLE